MNKNSDKKPTEQVERTGEQVGRPTSDTGKFGSPGELLAAYNALEREFTKRCQLLRQLQAEIALSAAQAAEAAAPTEPQHPEPTEPQHPEPNADESVCAPDDGTAPDGNNAPDDGTAPDGNNAPDDCTAPDGDGMPAALIESAIMYAEALAAVPEVMDACVARYKRSLMGRSLRTPPSGAAVITPAKRPTSLLEAKRLVDSILNG